MTEPCPIPRPIVGGLCIKTRDDGRYCIDVIQMAYNVRIVLTPVTSDHTTCDHGWCYFGHGVDANGIPRTKVSAQHAAVAAAFAWDGYGAPPGFDKQAF